MGGLRYLNNPLNTELTWSWRGSIGRLRVLSRYPSSALSRRYRVVLIVLRPLSSLGRPSVIAQGGIHRHWLHET